jgi:hypothetical protein
MYSNDLIDTAQARSYQELHMKLMSGLCSAR